MARAFKCDECKKLHEGDFNRWLQNPGAGTWTYKFSVGVFDKVRAHRDAELCDECFKTHLENFTEEICGYPVEEPAALDRKLIEDVIEYLRAGEHSTYRSKLRADSLQAMLDKTPEPEHIHNDNVVKAIKKLGNNALWDYADDGKSSVIMSMTLLPETRAEVIKLLEAAEQAGH